MSDLITDREAWREIEDAARDQVRANIDTLVSTKLEFGDHIAWVGQLYALTEGLSPVHRVGFPKAGHPYTSCHEQIPHPFLWLPLSPALVRTMTPCRFCEAEHQRSMGNEHAA